MFTFKRLIGSSLFVFVFAGPVLTQESRTPLQTPGEAVAPMPAGPLVTATATAERVRFVAPGTVIQVRLEVYNEAGQKVFDTELRGGNVLDWYLQNGGGERLPAGSYATVLTIKNLSGRLSQRVGSVEVTDKTAAIGIAGAAVFSLAQQQTIGPVEDNAVFTVLAEREKEALTAVMHDGTTGQLNRTAGALSFRLGDFFSGADTEQMRLTEAGNLGIGTAAPEFKLDVAGAVRAGQGFVFGNGSRLNVNEKGALQLTNAGGELIPDASGAGTQGRLAKWIDGAGTLGDSLINDTGTALQLTAAPNGGFDTNLMYLNSTNGTTGVLAGSSPSYSANNGPFFAMRGNTYTTIPNQRGIFTISAGNVGSPGPLEGVVKFNTGNDQVRMLITAAGNVGIGTNSPLVKLDVNGSARFTTGGSGGEINLTAPNGETGLTLSKPTAPTGRADIRFDGTTLKLFAGTGIVPPGNGITIGTSGGATITGANGDGAVLTARRSGENSFVVIDSTPASQSSVLAYRKNNFNRWLMFADSSPESGGNAGSDFKLDAYNDAGGGIANYLSVKRATGNVGIGTTGPATRLAISGGPTWTSASWTGSLSMGNASALGWEANTSGQRFGIGQTNGGLFFFRTNSVFGNTSAPANYDLVITDTGNITQARAKGGLVKAMAYINADGTINRCYNGITDSSTGNCGFLSSYAGAGSGVYYVNFNFQVTDRFISVTPLDGAGAVNIGSTFSFYVGVTPTNTIVQIKIFIPDVDYGDSGTQNSFMIIVY